LDTAYLIPINNTPVAPLTFLSGENGMTVHGNMYKSWGFSRLACLAIISWDGFMGRYSASVRKRRKV